MVLGLNLLAHLADDELAHRSKSFNRSKSSWNNLSQAFQHMLAIAIVDKAVGAGGPMTVNRSVHFPGKA